MYPSYASLGFYIAGLGVGALGGIALGSKPQKGKANVDIYPLEYAMTEDFLKIQRDYNKQVKKNNLEHIYDNLINFHGPLMFEILTVLRETIAEYQDAVIASYYRKRYDHVFQNTYLTDEHKRKLNQANTKWDEVLRRCEIDHLKSLLQIQSEKPKQHAQKEILDFFKELEIGEEYLSELRIKLK